MAYKFEIITDMKRSDNTLIDRKNIIKLLATKFNFTYTLLSAVYNSDDTNGYDILKIEIISNSKQVKEAIISSLKDIQKELNIKNFVIIDYKINTTLIKED